MQTIQWWNSATDSLFGQKRVWAFDLDDTLTSRGTVPAAVLLLLEQLQTQGHYVVMVTGRPSSWAQPFVKILPFDAVIAENGASMCYWKNGKLARSAGQEPSTLFWTLNGYVDHEAFAKSLDAQEHQKKKDLVGQSVFEQFPQMKVASDQMFRLYDLAIDFAEAVQPPRSLSEANAVKKIFEDHGAVAKVSSIHVNGWWGAFDKCLGLKMLFQSVQWGLSFGEVVYFGDSPNDAPLFEFAPLSVGVANLRHFDTDKSWVRPTFVTAQESSAGVLEALNYYQSCKKENL